MTSCGKNSPSISYQLTILTLNALKRSEICIALLSNCQDRAQYAAWHNWFKHLNLTIQMTPLANNRSRHRHIWSEVGESLIFRMRLKLTNADLAELERKICKLSRLSQCHLVQGHATICNQLVVAKVVANLK